MPGRFRAIPWDYFFLLWFLTESWFNHTIIGTLGQAFFMLYSMYKCLSIKRFCWSFFLIYYFLFCVVCYLNIYLGYAISPDHSHKMLGVVLRNFVFIFFLYQYIHYVSTESFLPFFSKACCISSFGILLIFYLNTGGFYMHDDDSLGIINANIQSVIDGFIIAWMIINKRYKVNDLLLLLFLFLFILLSGTKKSIITIIVVVGINMVLKNPKHIIRNLSGILALLVVLYIVLMKIPAVYDMIGSRFETLFSFMEGGDTDSSTKARDNFIELGLLYWADSPIWGRGLNSFGYLYGDDTTYSHNNYVELLCSVGIVGLISYYLMYIHAIISFIRVNNRIVTPLALSIIISFLITDYALVSYFERVLYIPIVLVYVLLSESREAPHNTLIKKQLKNLQLS